VVQNASLGTTSGFLASQGTIDQLSDAAGWLAASTTNANIHYIDCSTSDCSSASVLQAKAPSSAQQVTFVNGDINLSQGLVTYSGLYIVSGCLSINGQSTMEGSGPAAGVTALGTGCGGAAIQIAGGGTNSLPAWDGGTAYAANSSISISGTGKVKFENFYGAAIAAKDVNVTGNGLFAWESSLAAQGLTFGPYAIDSFAQY